MIWYETDRLILRNYLEKDTKDYYEYMSLESTALYEDFCPFSLEESKRAVMDRLQDDSYWVVELRQNKKVIGDVCYRENDYNTYEIAFDFHEKFGKKGYAAEACRILVKHIFTVLKGRRLYAGCNEENEASWRLLERLGMRREAYCLKDVSFKADEKGNPIYVNSYYYALLKEEWEQRDV